MSESHASVFLALWPDAAVRRECHQAGRQLHTLCGGSLMRAESLHLTLAFLGAVPSAQLLTLRAALRTLAVPRCLLRLDRFGHWRPGIIWLGMRDPPAELATLAANLRQILCELGVAYDRKPFKPHLTLLRHGQPPASWPDYPAIPWTTAEICLVASMRNAAGAQYRIVERFA